MLSIRGLCKSFPGPPPRVVLRDVDLELARAEFIAIRGESGSGKSTLLNLIAGLDGADLGSIVFDGVDLASMSDEARSHHRRTRLGFVFQAFHLLPYLSVAANVGLPLLLSGCDERKRDASVGEMLARIGLGERAAARPRELSGGEMQRVAIARALVHRPQLVLADEPTGNLDHDNARKVLGLLREMVNFNGAACILVTHSSTAARIADRVYSLDPDGLKASVPA